jgi:acyl-CoA synthetase (AMP-forming)/AMP-acid ligase II
VGEVAVVGRPDPEWGERVVALVVPADPGEPPDLASLRSFAADQLPRYAVPRELVLVDSLPRSSAGKLVRRLLA